MRKGLRDRSTMTSWISNVLAPYAKKLPPNRRRLLILDNFRRHISNDIRDALKKLNYDIETLPPNTTKYLQPLDLSVNRPFKVYVSDEWEAYSASLSEKDVTKSGNYKAPSRGVRMVWVSRAWLKINAKIVANGFNIYKNYKIIVTKERNEPNEEHKEQFNENIPKEIGMLYKDTVFHDNELSKEIVNDNPNDILEKDKTDDKKFGLTQTIEAIPLIEKASVQNIDEKRLTQNLDQEIEKLCDDLDVYFDLSHHNEESQDSSDEEEKDTFPKEFEGKSPSELLDFEIYEANEL